MNDLSSRHIHQTCPKFISTIKFGQSLKLNKHMYPPTLRTLTKVTGVGDKPDVGSTPTVCANRRKTNEEIVRITASGVCVNNY